MRFPLGERTLAMVLVVPTAIAVIMLGIVQYRWSEEVRSATSVRLADSLQMSMMSWHLNLFRDLSDICLRMRLDSNHVGGQELEQTVRRFQEQQASADYRDVVSGINLVPSDPQLPSLRWNADAQRFAPVQASHLEELQARLSRSPTTATPGTATPRSDKADGSAYTAPDSRDWRFAPAERGRSRRWTPGAHVSCIRWRSDPAGASPAGWCGGALFRRCQK